MSAFALLLANLTLTLGPMVFNPSIDLGQLIVATLLTIIGYFVKKELSTLTRRLDQHEQRIFNLVGDVQKLIGVVEISRRLTFRRSEEDSGSDSLR